MSYCLGTPAETERLTMMGLLTRLALSGAALMGVTGAFAYFGGWFSTDEPTPAGFIDRFEQINGVHVGFRRNHAKGLGVTGFFESNGNGVRLSKAAVFEPGARAGNRTLFP
jgi:catalase